MPDQSPPPNQVQSPAQGKARRTHARSDRPLLGIVLIVISTMFNAGSDVLAKYLANALPAAEIAWIRFFCFSAIILTTLLVTLGPSGLRTTMPRLQILRGLTIVSSSLLFITSLSFIPVADATATAFIAPIFVTALSVLFLGETVGRRRWTAAVIGLIGVLIVVRPGTSAFHPGALLTICSALGWACTLVVTRKMSGHDHTLTTLAYSALVGFVILCFVVPFVWVPLTQFQLFLCVMIGLVSTGGQWITVMAYRYADASVLAPFSYAQLIFVTLLGFGIFGHIPDFWTFVGAGIIIASGLYTANRERIRRSQMAQRSILP